MAALPRRQAGVNNLDGQPLCMRLNAWDERNHVFATDQFVVLTFVGREWLETQAPGCFKFHQLWRSSLVQMVSW